jgi:enamine deaminase RidA (YjgF/YER057c/UK114 family)
MLVNMTTWSEAARAHGEYFGTIRPTCTFVQVSRFIDPQWLVEIEADAICSPARAAFQVANRPDDNSVLAL